jgi:hypothetical protein
MSSPHTLRELAIDRWRKSDPPSIDKYRYERIFYAEYDTWLRNHRPWEEAQYNNLLQESWSVKRIFSQAAESIKDMKLGCYYEVYKDFYAGIGQLIAMRVIKRIQAMGDMMGQFYSFDGREMHLNDQIELRELILNYANAFDKSEIGKIHNLNLHVHNLHGEGNIYVGCKICRDCYGLEVFLDESIKPNAGMPPSFTQKMAPNMQIESPSTTSTSDTSDTSEATYTSSGSGMGTTALAIAGGLLVAGSM